jgi:predicted O-methyltransferase YrrM
MNEKEKLRATIEEHPDWLELETEIATLLEIDFRLEAYFLDTLKGINFQQMLMLYREGDAIQPHTIVEIGSRAGCSSGIFAMLAKKHGGLVHCVDPAHHSLWAFNMEKYKLSHWCVPIRAASPWVSWNKPIDILFLDGNHDMLPVLVDFYYWYGFVKEGGLIAFHDTNIRLGVQRAMAMVENLYPIERIAAVEHGTGAVMFRKP